MFAFNVVNAILTESTAFVKVFGPLAEQFGDGQVDEELLYRESITVGRVNIALTEREESYDFIMEAFPLGDENRNNRKYIDVSQSFVETMTEEDMTEAQKNNLFFIILISLLHECSHMLTPIFNVLAGRAATAGTPERLGQITIGSRLISDCGYALENLLFNNAYLGSTNDDYHSTHLSRIIVIAEHAGGDNLQRRLVPNGVVAYVRSRLERWERRRWMSICCNPFPWNVLQVELNYESLLIAVPAPVTHPAAEPLMGGKLRVHIPIPAPAFSTPPKRLFGLAT